MELSAKLVRAQLHFFQALCANCSLETTRKGQDKLGELMSVLHKREVYMKDHDFGAFQGAWDMPKDERRSGVILYLHGGGYTCGSLEYAKGFAATLASQCGVRVFCAAYRLAPENPYPAAVDDALEAYRYLLKKGYAPRQNPAVRRERRRRTDLRPEPAAAAGGLGAALGLSAFPRGWISPAQGSVYETNRDNDPSLTQELLEFYAKCYTTDPADPLCSPVFGDLTGFPPSLLFAGGDEILLDDARALHEKLVQSGCRSTRCTSHRSGGTPMLYCLSENMEEDMEAIDRFLTKNLSPARSLRWMRLDNATKIYPAAKRRNWNNFFRLSATLTGAGGHGGAAPRPGCHGAPLSLHRRAAAPGRVLVLFGGDPQSAAHPAGEKAARWPTRRFMRCGSVRSGCWCIMSGSRWSFSTPSPTARGRWCSLKSLLAEYLSQKYGLVIPAEKGVLGRLEEPSAEEVEDSFARYAGDVKLSRREATALSPQRYARAGRL